MGVFGSSFAEDTGDVVDGHSQSSRTSDNVIRLAALEASVFDIGSPATKDMESI